MNMTRRGVFATAGAAATALTFQQRANAQSFEFKPNQRYPDASVEILDPSFAKYRLFSSSVEQLASGMRWAEGPVWFGDGRYLLVSDIPNNRIMRYDEANGNWGVFRQPSNFANGNARDRQGRLISCEHLTRRVTRTWPRTTACSAGTRPGSSGQRSSTRPAPAISRPTTSR